MSLYISQFSVEVWVPGEPAPVSYDCIDGVCIDPGDGSGAFATLEECVQSGCAVVPPPPVGTFTMDAGEGSTWYIALQISDSGDELRDKCIKPLTVTGKGANRVAKVYAYQPTEEIDVGEIEDGTGASAVLPVPDAAKVTRTKRLPVNVPNAMNWTVRLEGEWDGTGERDRVDQISIEQARQGVRR